MYIPEITMCCSVQDSEDEFKSTVVVYAIKQKPAPIGAGFAYPNERIKVVRRSVSC